MILITIYIIKGTAFGEQNSCCKVMCIVLFVLSGIRLFLKIISFILLIIAFTLVDRWIKESRSKGPSAGNWMAFLIPYIIFLIIEVLQLLCVIYIYKLLKLKSNTSYSEYLKNGQSVEQVSVTVTNAQISQTPPIFPNQNTPSSQQKVMN
jgi:cytochrome b subunit of formate dehydrogenase